MKNCPEASVAAEWNLKKKEGEVIYHFFHLSDEGSQNNKKEEEEEVCENEYKSHLISLIFLLITANFPLGPWERASVCRCHLICRLHISPCWAAPSVPSPRPPLAGACGEVGLLGPPLFRPGEESPERARSKRVALSEKEEREKRKTWRHCFIKRQPFHKQTYQKRPPFTGSN